jgi:DNA-directed RNA polymerase specialized sigma24 family protein
MNTTAARASEPAVTTKRKQKYINFTLLPSDAALLPSLSEEQRTLLQTEGRYKERALKLGLLIGTVRSRLHRARAALQRLREND